MINKKKIINLYKNKRLNGPEIAKIMNMGTTSVYRILKTNKILRRSRGESNEKLNINQKSQIKKLYFNKGYSLNKIAKIFNVSMETIRNNMIKLGLKPTFPRVKKDILEKLYIKEKKTLKEIGSIFNVDGSTILHWLKHYKIKRRNVHDYPEIQKNHNNKLKKMWANPSYRIKAIKSILKGMLKRPTSFEQKICDLCLKYHLPFIYSGDGRILIGYKNPDFIDEKNKIIIEVFLNYFKIKRYGSVENYIKERGKYFAKYGYKTIFIREEEVMAKNWETICLNKIMEIKHANK